MPQKLLLQFFRQKPSNSFPYHLLFSLGTAHLLPGIPWPFAPTSSAKYTRHFFNISAAVSSVMGKDLSLTKCKCKGVSNQEIFKLGQH